VQEAVVQLVHPVQDFLFEAVVQLVVQSPVRGCLKSRLSEAAAKAAPQIIAKPCVRGFEQLFSQLFFLADWLSAAVLESAEIQ
jgi:hypothetical protein